MEQSEFFYIPERWRPRALSYSEEKLILQFLLDGKRKLLLKRIWKGFDLWFSLKIWRKLYMKVESVLLSLYSYRIKKY